MGFPSIFDEDDVTRRVTVSLRQTIYVGHKKSHVHFDERKSSGFLWLPVNVDLIVLEDRPGLFHLAKLDGGKQCCSDSQEIF